RIWSYLADRRASTRYVLLVGDISQIPMRLLYPDGNIGNAAGFGSDYYYAKLNTPSWDVDGDDRWGEFYHDNLDFYPDVIVGRLPFSNSVYIENFVTNTIAYEQDTGAWKKNVLFAHGFMNHNEPGKPETDCAWTAARIVEDFLVPYGWPSTTLFEWGGINPSDYAPYSSDSLCQANYDIYSGIGQQGVINCMAHGNTGTMNSYQWGHDLDGDGLAGDHQEYERNYFSQYFRIGWDPVSALVFMCGCNTGVLYEDDPAFATSNMRSRYLFTDQVETTSLLRYLETGAPAVIGSSAGSDYATGWQDHTNGLSQSLNYYFYYYLVSHRMRASGNAL
ncbi:C25 family cysteine peptidase, partial [Candidatus Eisenbacteria bacterium]